MSNRHRGNHSRVGASKASAGMGGMDIFNYNMLSILKTKEERLGLMERMSYINDTLSPQVIESEPELEVGTLRAGASPWESLTDRNKGEYSR